MPYLADFDPESLKAWLAERSEPWAKPFRAKQLLTHYYHKLTPTYADMTDLPQAMRETLAEELPLDPVEVVREVPDGDGSTKLGIRPLAGKPRANTAASPSDGPKPSGVIPKGGTPSGVIECVIMRDEDRDSRTICVSSQVGCAMGCQFCASGLLGLERNLQASEIIGQIRHAAIRLQSEGYAEVSAQHHGRRTRANSGQQDGRGRIITNLVFMGVGEPLANAGNLIQALRALTEPWGMGLSARRITISTVGLLVGIQRLTELDLPINLALSLHAADDETRSRIIPTRPGLARGEDTESAGAAMEVDRLLDQCDAYYQKTGREVTLEFILLPEVNDHQAVTLADLIERHPRGRYNVNVIPYNRVEEFDWREPTGPEVHRFLAELKQRGINAHARKKMGYRVNGACGQLRLQQAQTQAG